MTDVVTALNDVLIRHSGSNEVRLKLLRGGQRARVRDSDIQSLSRQTSMAS